MKWLLLGATCAAALGLTGCAAPGYGYGYGYPSSYPYAAPTYAYPYGYPGDAYAAAPDYYYGSSGWYPAPAWGYGGASVNIVVPPPRAAVPPRAHVHRDGVPWPRPGMGAGENGGPRPQWRGPRGGDRPRAGGPAAGGRPAPSSPALRGLPPHARPQGEEPGRGP